MVDEKCDCCENTAPSALYSSANELRAKLKLLEMECRDLMAVEGIFGNVGEVKANIMLTVRHIEDARMRLGKVIQYSGDGVSCYDK